MPEAGTKPTTDVTVSTADKLSSSAIKNALVAFAIPVVLAIADQLALVAPQLADFLASLLPVYLVFLAPYIKGALLGVSAWLAKKAKEQHDAAVEVAKEMPPSPQASSPKKYY